METRCLAKSSTQSSRRRHGRSQRRAAQAQQHHRLRAATRNGAQFCRSPVLFIAGRPATLPPRRRRRERETCNPEANEPRQLAALVAERPAGQLGSPSVDIVAFTTVSRKFPPQRQRASERTNDSTHAFHRLSGESHCRSLPRRAHLSTPGCRSHNHKKTNTGPSITLAYPQASPSLHYHTPRALPRTKQVNLRGCLVVGRRAETHITLSVALGKEAPVSPHPHKLHPICRDGPPAV